MKDAGLVNSFQNRFEFLNREKESTFNLNLIRLGARGYNPTIGRFDRTDPVIEGQEQFSLYHYSFNNPVLFSDADGLMGESCCQSAIDFVAGATLRFIDNNSPVPTSLDGGGYRGSAYESGRKFGDALSIVSGGFQVIAGAIGALGAGGAEVVTAGAASPLAIPAGAAAIATMGNGANTISKALGNLNSEGAKNSGGNLNKSDDKSGRGKNHLQPDKTAQGNHSTFRTDPQSGKTTNTATYKQNSRNPKTGFDETKRVDVKGASHRHSKTGQEIPTPHVHEAKQKDPRPAEPNELPRQ